MPGSPLPTFRALVELVELPPKDRGRCWSWWSAAEGSRALVELVGPAEGLRALVELVEPAEGSRALVELVEPLPPCRRSGARRETV